MSLGALAGAIMSYGPYSSREMHKFVRYGTDRKGERTTEKPSFVGFGTKEKPEPYTAGKIELPDRWKYKQWKSQRSPVNAGDGYFGWPPPKGAPKDATYVAFEYPGGKKEMKLEYVDRTRYKDAKRPDKVSFQSKDASRRDEFSNTFRTEQHRESLKREQNITSGHNNPAEELEELMKTRQGEDRGFTHGLSEPEFLFDIGREAETEFDPKAHRDRFYTQTLEKNSTRPKRMGPYATMSSSVGDHGEALASRPENGRVHVTKSFYDKGHLASSN